MDFTLGREEHAQGMAALMRLWTQGLLTELIGMPTAEVRRRTKAAHADALETRGWTAPMRAILLGLPKAQVLASIRETPAELIDALDFKGRTALFFAVQDGRASDAIVDALLDAGANPVSGAPFFSKIGPRRYPSPLMRALQEGDANRAEKLWRRAPAEAAAARIFWTHGSLAPDWNLLHYFVSERNYFAARWLMQKLGDDYVVGCCGPNVRTTYNALETALTCNQTVIASAMMATLRRRGVFTDLPHVPTPGEQVSFALKGTNVLHRLAELKCGDAMCQVLFGTDALLGPENPLFRDAIDRPREDGYTPLHVAVCASAGVCAQLLVVAGASRVRLAQVHPLKPPMTPYAFARKKLKRRHEQMSPHVYRVLKPTDGDRAVQ